MLRAFAALAAGCLLAVLAPAVSAQINPPVAAPSGPVNPPGIPVPPQTTPDASASAAPAPDASPSASPVPLATPTLPPMLIDPAVPAVEPGRQVVARVNGSFGGLSVTVADPTIVTVVIDQTQRALYITGQNVGSTIVTVTDTRGSTRDVLVRVAYAAGTIPEQTSIRVTGDPASAAFLRAAITQAVVDAAVLRPGARAYVPPDTVPIRTDLPVDDRTHVDVPVQLLGEGYFTVNGTVHVDVENVALPRIVPSQLLVSDYPERLTADGVLFTATIDRTSAQRFLYYHFNPGTEPGRRVLVKVTNASSEPAVVQLIASLAGPGTNEMEVGHTASRGFLVGERRNEGTVVTIPPNATVNLINHALPPNAIVNGIFQMREVSGDPLNLTIVAQGDGVPLDQSVDRTVLLAGGAAHARGVYPVPEFFADYTFFVDAPPLEIPIGQLPLPNLREGEALSGDYGVKVAARVVIVNTSRQPAQIALYANPRGGAATGTFIIDNTLVQAHRLAAFSRYKIWQETIAPGTYRTLQVSTLPEGGSSYPLRLVFAPDDGSVAPGAPGSPIY